MLCPVPNVHILHPLSKADEGRHTNPQSSSFSTWKTHICDNWSHATYSLKLTNPSHFICHQAKEWAVGPVPWLAICNFLSRNFILLLMPTHPHPQYGPIKVLQIGNKLKKRWRLRLPESVDNNNSFSEHPFWSGDKSQPNSFSSAWIVRRNILHRDGSICSLHFSMDPCVHREDRRCSRASRCRWQCRWTPPPPPTRLSPPTRPAPPPASWTSSRHGFINL